MPKNFKDWSRNDWSRTDDLKLTNEQLTVGCLQRIADATEIMAKNYLQLQKDADYWKQEYYHELNRRESYQRSVTAHKASYTKLKNKYDAAKTELEISDGIIGDLQKQGK